MKPLLSKHRKAIRYISLCFIICLSAFMALTYLSIQPIERSFRDIISDSQSIRITDRNDHILNISYQEKWNKFDHVQLAEFPSFLKEAFIYSEDRDFYHHDGVNWPARLSALWQNIKQRRVIRGASTITEQVVRTINPRPRNLWSRWIEGFEAARLERSVTKNDIFEFYLNQVPYASHRRGLTQAARYYFNRDIQTLSRKEMLALVILVRSPTGYDLYKDPQRIEKPLQRLAASMSQDGFLSAQELPFISAEKLSLENYNLPIEARHFSRYVRLNSHSSSMLKTTLDGELQTKIQTIIDNRLKSLSGRNVSNAAVMIADYKSGEILAWVVGGANNPDLKTNEIDAVISPRQPGSALKPFLYAASLDKGWTAATLINDSPMAEAVGHGLHRFKNYSNTHYGLLTLRESLGNSLNIPALLTINYVGSGHYLSLLQQLGFESLNQQSNIYDEGLALGNGEVTLYEMVNAYAALANKGEYRPLHFLQQSKSFFIPRQVFSEESASIIGNILSDSKARRLEFGSGSVLNFPYQTAAKTGTSTDYRDAWTMAYNDQYVVGIWMGNLDRSPMNQVTGASGPALAMRSIFAILNDYRETEPLYQSPKLVRRNTCIRPASKDGFCPERDELFMPDHIENNRHEYQETAKKIELVRPTDGLQMAYDPRIPLEHQNFRFEIKNVPVQNNIEWVLDGKSLGKSLSPQYLWPVKRGQHILSVIIHDENAKSQTLPDVHFLVK